MWYGAFGDAAGRVVLAREPDTATGYDLAVFTTDTQTDAAGIIARYAERWSIEPANATGKDQIRLFTWRILLQGADLPYPRCSASPRRPPPGLLRLKSISNSISPRHPPAAAATC